LKVNFSRTWLNGVRELFNLRGEEGNLKQVMYTTVIFS